MAGLCAAVTEINQAYSPICPLNILKLLVLKTGKL